MGKQRLKKGFYWRHSTIWVRVSPLTGKPASTRCHDPDAAYLWRAEQERLAASPSYAASRSATVEDWVNRTMAHKASRRREGTLHMYRIKLGHVLRLFGAEAPLSSITPGAVDEYITTRRREGVTNNTIQRELTCLRQMLRLAKRAGAFGGDIEQIMPVDFSAEYQPVKRVLKPEHLPLLWNALRSDEERAWVAFALATGADVGDVERARPEDYDAARGVVRLRGTKNAQRDAEVPVPVHMAELFAFAHQRLPVSWPRASKALGEACARAGIPHLSPKDLRRTASSWMIAAGAAQSLVSRFLRHGSDAMVRRVYGQLTPEQLGALLTTQTETKTVQVPEKQQGPLGGIGRRGGFKSRSGQYTDGGNGEDDADSRGSDRSHPARVSADQSTETLQAPAAAWSLALAAENLLPPRKVRFVKGRFVQRRRDVG